MNKIIDPISEYKLGDYPDLDTLHMQEVAAEAYIMLSLGGGVVEAVFTPGDMTQYNVLIIDSPPLANSKNNIQHRSGSIVALLGGKTHPWDGSKIHWTYGLSWGETVHSARIVALFLSYMAEAKTELVMSPSTIKVSSSNGK